MLNISDLKNSFNFFIPLGILILIILLLSFYFINFQKYSSSLCLVFLILVYVLPKYNILDHQSSTCAYIIIFYLFIGLNPWFKYSEEWLIWITSSLHIFFSIIYYIFNKKSKWVYYICLTLHTILFCIIPIPLTGMIEKQDDVVLYVSIFLIFWYTEMIIGGLIEDITNKYLLILSLPILLSNLILSLIYAIVFMSARFVEFYNRYPSIQTRDKELNLPPSSSPKMLKTTSGNKKLETIEEENEEGEEMIIDLPEDIPPITTFFPHHSLHLHLYHPKDLIKRTEEDLTGRSI